MLKIYNIYYTKIYQRDQSPWEGKRRGGDLNEVVLSDVPDDADLVKVADAGRLSRRKNPNPNPAKITNPFQVSPMLSYHHKKNRSPARQAAPNLHLPLTREENPKKSE